MTKKKRARQQRREEKKKRDAEMSQQVQQTMATARRRLDVMEYLMLAFAGVLALLGGAVAAWGLQAAAGFPFRVSWAVCSLLMFTIPGVFVLGRERQTRGANTMTGSTQKDSEPNHG